MPPATPSADLLQRNAMAEPQGLPFLGGECRFFCSAAPVAKDGMGGSNPGPNQDAMTLIPFAEEEGVLAVADGVGGIPGGERASVRALSLLADAVACAAREKRPLREGILDGFEAANRGVCELASGATTLAVAEIGPGWVRSYHVGDSVVMVSDRGGMLRSQTVPHSPVGRLLAAGLLDEEEAMEHELLHLIDNVVGSADMRIEIGPPVDFASGDSLLLASDGLTDNLYLHELVEGLCAPGLDLAARRLLLLCHERMRGEQPELPCKPDDLAFMLYRSARH